MYNMSNAFTLPVYNVGKAPCLTLPVYKLPCLSNTLPYGIGLFKHSRFVFFQLLSYLAKSRCSNIHGTGAHVFSRSTTTAFQSKLSFTIFDLGLHVSRLMELTWSCIDREFVISVKGKEEGMGGSQW